MKKILTLFIGTVLIYSCSTSSDENNNSNTNVIPLAPTDLSGSVVSPSQINLSWTDNSSNETGFKIERRTETSTYTIVGTVNQDLQTFSDSGLNQNTTYTYRVCAYNAVGNSQTYTNEVTLTTTVSTSLPTLTTTAASLITQTTASSGGTISSDGGASITARGVCWSTSSNPTISLTTKTTDGSGVGAFTSNITGLSANTTYYVRAYATNSVGTAYGNQLNITTLQNSSTLNVAGPNITDIDGNTYQSVTNCGITFSKQNLNVSKYTDGTPIPQVTNFNQWMNLTTGAWCYYENNTANGVVYGKLYNWYAVMGIYDAASLNNASLRKKLAPTGWHIPSDAEWTQLTDCLGGVVVAGGKMKATGTSLWNSPNTAATNESGFSALPGGWLYNGGPFGYIGVSGFWWSSTEFNNTNARSINVDYNYGASFSSNFKKWYGYSVRCVKD
jgi:uncharacterized protein (TIGR02145 family)